MATRRKGRAPNGRASVALLSPAGPHWYRLQYVDPDDDKRKRKAVPRDLTTKKAREEFRAEFEKKLNGRQIDLDRGATRKSGTAIADAVERYYAQADLVNETSYRLATGGLIEWYEAQGKPSCDTVDAENLMRWREHLITGRRKNGAQYSKATIDTRLRKAKTALFYMHRAKLLPAISRDEIAEACEQTKNKKKGTRPKPKPFLYPDEIRGLFAALERHDKDTFAESRAKHPGKGTPGRARRLDPLAPFFAFMLLSGLRREEALGLTWDRVHLGGVGWLDVDEDIAKGGRRRTVHLDVSPMALTLLKARKLQTGGGKGLVWPFTEDESNQALKRLRNEYGAPAKFDNKALRRTTATYLTNAPGIYAAASVWRSAKQLGHSPEVAENNYLGLVTDIDPKADTLEAALEISEEIDHVVDTMATRRPRSAPPRPHTEAPAIPVGTFDRLPPASRHVAA